MPDLDPGRWRCRGCGVLFHDRQECDTERVPWHLPPECGACGAPMERVIRKMWLAEDRDPEANASLAARLEHSAMGEHFLDSDDLPILSREAARTFRRTAELARAGRSGTFIVSDDGDIVLPAPAGDAETERVGGEP